ncbi:MAG: bifunctional (p)ppGpp synthetase/guanosine-3',5'-bis(diphosphate) 3'-pyrophosphohydrolase [Tidjanibacter sp.]|nr:bifunctional (p)ppGpp synthetase/guanosine-3',5'-bis(diphosphate) 3'-pyrophosphohydrolase [Tidjanibacter sp.]
MAAEGYSEANEILIEEKYNELMLSCNKICKSEADWDFVTKAFMLAKEAHKGVLRRSGEPYILHPIAVAKIVVDEIGLGVKSVVSSLLHDVVEDTPYTVEDIETLFNPKIASMVDSLTKMAGVFNHEESKQAEHFRKVLLTLSDDVRVILIKIADRLHNMRTLDSMPRNKQVKIASETLYLFAPLAYRLGLFEIKTELEDLSLRYRFPEQYFDIKRRLNETEAGRSEFIDRFCDPIRERLQESGIEFKISGRVKSVYSIWSKMQNKQVTFDDIYDLFAVRVVFTPTQMIPEKSQCWHIYSLITDIYRPKPDRIRDWVNFPKANGYEALHATVMGPDGIWVEIQIRSERMDAIAERGFAAHWNYKQSHSTEDEFDKWLKDVRNALNNPSQDAVAFLDNVKLTLYASEIVVFTPKGEARKMPLGATALDFAYEVHTNVGNKAIGAKINHKIETIYTPLNSGDQIQIITSENTIPSVEWLEHVTTAKAKQAIVNYLKRSRQNNIERGIAIFEQRMHEFGITPSARVFRKILPAYDCSSKDEFYSKLGSEIINLKDVEVILRQNSKNKILKFWTFELTNPFKSSKGKTPMVVKSNEELSEDAPKFAIAECCNPIPGDDITGFLDVTTNTVVVHKSTCPELVRLASQWGDRINANIKWASYKAESYLAEVEIRGIDRIGVVTDIAQVISVELATNMRALNIMSHDGIFEGTISVYVKDTDKLQDLLDKLSEVKGVDKVQRINS